MNHRILVFTSISIIAVVILLIYWYLPDPSEQNLTFDALNGLLREDLSKQNVAMSSPVRLQSQEAIAKYCSLFSDERQQSLVKYCTSTELKDAKGKFLGNIHMVGSGEMPQVVMALIQTDPLMSELDTVKTVFHTVIDDVVCKCWEDIRPGGMSSLNDWIDGLKQFHQSDTQPHSRSTQLKLGQKTIQLELTTNDDGYLWQLFIYS
ncbi:hypothetical protein [Candidatus Nitrosotenuis uzonensis]|uniref:Extracellular protein n=1 Tax=Candidatus Nitrosotenuis uzonensis TaxID=1407055 RepID=V6AT39_9ARCH|nr:hypothetical protein [Candidatus Nitrosotenuis uzonensis]CDI05812.1 putative Extracellular protein [Candidatus Nitrosotenuis uzonensis]